MRRVRQLLSAGLAIALGVAFVATTLLFTASANKSVADAAASPVEGSAVVVGGTSGAEPVLVSADQVRAIQRVPGVTGVRPVVKTTLLAGNGAYPSAVQAQTLPALDEQTRLTSGRLPGGPEEVLIDQQAAAEFKTQADGKLVVQTEEGPRTLQVSGVLSPGANVVSGQHDSLLFAADPLLFELRGMTGYDDVYISGTDPEELRTRIAELPGVAGSKLTVRTGEQEIAARVASYSKGTEALATFLLAFGAVSMFVAALVIANTFSILVVQRTRELGLLRCVGATRQQVFRRVLGEAAGLGVVASVVGVLIGIGLTTIGVRLAEGMMSLTGVALAWWALLVPIVLGVLITVLSAIRPARAATRVAPLAALRPIGVTEGRRSGVVAAVLGVLLFLAGAAGLVVGATSHSVGVGIAGGVLNFVGVLLLARMLVPALVGALGPLLRVTGPTGTMAVANARRNPARAAATASALLVGVALIAMMVTGAATAQRSTQIAIDRQFPVDAQLNSAEPFTAQQLDAVRRVDGVRGVVTMRTAALPITGANGQAQNRGVVAVPAEARSVVNRPQLVESITDTTLVAGEKSGWRAGEKVRLGEPGRQVELSVVLSPEADALLVSDATGDRLGMPAASQAWVGFDPGTDGEALERQIAEVAGPGVEVMGIASIRAMMTQIVDLALQIVTALLGVAVIIALVGVGNTLGLSVLERTRESALLRALGLTRGQLRGMLGLEALSLGLVAVVLGAALGIGYGIAASYALIGGQLPVQVAVPWLRLLLMVAVALVAAWLASVLPARRAAKVAPAAAMAVE
ncbi:hypothetical protein CGZ95_19910 [Enemella evansiae]|uniref:ABC transporter permease n=1 Tax=Enemella evansiae TaxID=2016499 RepID=UPI000B9671E8|nr:ABC transporter permease [Enemella evansiae]OYN92936.1 hypothetical protein CGZ95_19910 [Enemella evansiae]